MKTFLFLDDRGWNCCQILTENFRIFFKIVEVPQWAYMHSQIYTACMVTGTYTSRPPCMLNVWWSVLYIARVLWSPKYYSWTDIERNNDSVHRSFPQKSIRKLSCCIVERGGARWWFEYNGECSVDPVLGPRSTRSSVLGPRSSVLGPRSSVDPVLGPRSSVLGHRSSVDPVTGPRSTRSPVLSRPGHRSSVDPVTGPRSTRSPVLGRPGHRSSVDPVTGPRSTRSPVLGRPGHRSTVDPVTGPR